MADETIKSKFLKRKDVQDAIIHIILDHYTESELKTPIIIEENSNDLLDTSNNDENEIKNIFEITTNPTDYITVADVDNILEKIQQ